MSDSPPPPPPPPPPDLTPPPDGFFHNSPTPMAPIARVRGIATASIVVIGLVVLALAVITVLTPGATDKARDFLDGTISEDEFLDGYGVLGVAQFAQSIATLVAAVLTMVWMVRMSKNVRAFGRNTTWAPLFGVFGWFLPPVLVVIPALMLRELWKASTPSRETGDWRKAGEYPLVWIWFLIYGVGQTVLLLIQASTLVGGGLTGDAVDLAEAIDEAGSLSLISGAVQIAAGLVWIVLVRQLTDRHSELTGER